MKPRVLRMRFGPMVALPALLGSLLAVMVLLSSVVKAEAPAVEINVPGGDDLTRLTIEGVASRSVEQDGTVARFSISVLDESVLTAVSTGNNALADVRTALQMGCNDDHPDQLCVPTDQLQTTSIRIHEEYDWTEAGRVSIGFRYENALIARIDGVDDAGRLIDTILTAGGDHVRLDGLNFTASGRAEAERQTLLDAIDDAQATADSIAAHMGYEVVRLVELSPIGRLSASRVAEEEAQAEAALADEGFEPTPVFGGSETVTSRIRMVFELRPLSADEE